MHESSNIKQFTVSELNKSIKQIIENQFNYIKVSGEVSKIFQHSSGHLYFTLKDEIDNISSVCWRTNVKTLKVIPKDGDYIIIKGRITTYAPQSKYQLIVDSIDYEGEGYLLKKFEILKKKLLDEGLFDDEKKKALPLVSEKICVITSQSGAVIRDIIHRVKERFQLEIIIYPVKVQGKDSVEEIVNAINVVNSEKMYGNKIFDVDFIIIARGGGSFEDLMSFNDEKVVRAIDNSVIPVVSAIGHETDVTLSDFVSDLRASTPTAAVELALPVKKELLENLKGKTNFASKLLQGIIEHKLIKLEREKNKLPNLNHVIEQNFQSLDFIEIRLNSLINSLLRKKKLNLKDFSINFQPTKFETKIKIIEQKIKQILLRLNNKIILKIQKNKQECNSKTKLLNSLSYKNILKRGFSVARMDKKIISDGKKISLNSKVEIEFFSSKVTLKKVK
tara:strand:+ start:23192 stop:24535 length:1344 start_codon:yes stop_codon:yes gene_type:complete